ncbi:MAG: hypothetical protein KKA84_04110 [Bacteroidetes bacterium]|nr:hypothetical protein [Bacteroidota bacterium]
MKHYKILFQFGMLVSLTAVQFGQGFTISNNAVLSLGSATLSLSSNFENNGIFNPQNGTVEFSGPTGNQTYTDATQIALNNMRVNKASGDVLINNDITINGMLTCLAGDLNLNGKTIYLGPAALLSESAGATVKGTSGHIEATREINTPNALNAAGLGFEITSIANLGSTKIIRRHIVQTTNTNGSILRYYDVIPTTNTGLDATLTVFYDGDELNGLDENALQLFRSTNAGGSWVRQGGIADTPNKKITLTNVNSLSFWTLGNNQSIYISNPGASTSYAEGSSLVVFPAVLLSDPDDMNCAGAEIQITNNYISSEDRLSFINKNGINGTWDLALGKLTLTGIATKDTYVDAVRSVTYINGSTNPTESVRTISLTVSDGNVNSNVLTRNIEVTEANNIPIVRFNSGVEVVEGGSFIFSDENIKATDPDGPSYSIIFDVVEEPLYGELSFNNALLKTGASFTFTQNDIANGKLKYTHHGGEADTDYFVFTLTDNRGGISNPFTLNISIKGVNDPPAVEELANIVMEEDEPFFLGLSYWYECLNDPDDNDSTLTFSMNCTSDNVCLTAINDTLYKITSEENYFGIDTVWVMFNDPTGDSCLVKTALVIQAVNDLPEINGLPSVITITRGKVESLDLLKFIEDIETPDSLLRISFEINSDSIFASYNARRCMSNFMSMGSFLGSTTLTIIVVDEEGGRTSATTYLNVVSNVTEQEDPNYIPTKFVLQQNYPNPFNPSTTIRYGIPSSTDNFSILHVQLKVYDILGNEVATLVNQPQSPGYYEYKWNGINNSSGIYFYVLSVNSESNKYREVKKMILIK